MCVLLIGAALVFGACGGGGDEEATDTDPAADDTAAGGGEDAGGDTGAGGGQQPITIEDFKFAPTFAVKPGSKVEVVNKDSAPHTVTADNGEFDSGNVTDTGSITAPDKPGQYPFRCKIHPSMAGTLTVAG